MSKINSIICLDFETGGLDPSKNPALQIAYQAFNLDDYKPILEFSSYIQNYDDLKVEKAATDFNGITPQMTANGMDTEDLVKKICEDFTAANTSKNYRTKPILMGQNIGFDIGFLMYLFRKHKVDASKFLDCNKDYNGIEVPKTIDTLSMGKQKWANDTKLLKYNLGAMVGHAGIPLYDAHDALNDVRATKELFFYFTNNLRTGAAVSVESKANRVRNTFKLV